MTKKSFLLIFFFLSFILAGRTQQLTLVPQVGLQFVKSKLEYSTLPSINNRYRHLHPYIGARLLYQGRKGHGPFLGFAIGASGYSYELFYPSGIGMDAYDHLRSSSMKGLWRIELGYHWNSRPIYFKKILDYRYAGIHEMNSPQRGWSVRIQPMIGAAYQLINDEGSGWVEHTLNGIVVREDDIVLNRKANFALLAGLGFEFGKNDKRKFSLSFNYVRGLGESITRSKLTINTASANYYGLLGSNGTSCNITLGIPISLGKKKK